MCATSTSNAPNRMPADHIGPRTEETPTAEYIPNEHPLVKVVTRPNPPAWLRESRAAKISQSFNASFTLLRIHDAASAEGRAERNRNGAVDRQKASQPKLASPRGLTTVPTATIDVGIYVSGGLLMLPFLLVFSFVSYMLLD